MDPHHEQREQPGTHQQHETREYEYPNPESELGPAPPHQYERLVAKQKSHKGRWALITLLIILLLAAAGAGAYFLFLKPEAKPAAKQTASPATTKTPETKTPAVDTAAATLKSTKLNLQVAKPSGWTGQEDPATGELTLTSPETTYTSNGTSTAGVFVLKFRQGADSGAQTAIHDTNAVQDSESIAYSKPTANQYQYTNITVAGKIDVPSYLIVTSSEQFKKGEAMARFFINGDTYVIIGGFRAADKTGLMGYDSLTIAAFNGSKEYKEAIATIKSLEIF